MSFLEIGDMHVFKLEGKGLLMVQWLRRHAHKARGWSLIPGLGTISHMSQLKIPRATTKIQRSNHVNKKAKSSSNSR